MCREIIEVDVGYRPECVKSTIEHVYIVSQFLIVYRVGGRWPVVGNVFQAFPFGRTVISQELVSQLFSVAPLISFVNRFLD